MVAVIVDDGDAVDLADLGEAPLDAAELGEAALDHLVGDAQLGATPIAASAFWTLWRPGIGSSMPAIVADLAVAVAQRRRRSGCRPGPASTLSPRTSAWAAKP